MSQNGLKHLQNGSSTLLSPPSAPAAESWRQMNVRDFFTRVNWTDQPPEVQAIQLSTRQGDRPGASLQLTVSQFFSSIPWDGREAAAPIAAQEIMGSAPKQDSGFTIDDFAGLF
ncbi:MAG: hypothetical protein ACO4AI_06945 [Prochlorothrix sp.]|nr:hypothetical protein [Prochlorothrix sp.]